MLNGVVALWRLLEACRGGASADIEPAAANAVRCLATAVSPCDAQVRLRVVAGDLWVDGVLAQTDFRLFAAVRGLTDALLAAKVAELRLSREIREPALTAAALRLLRLVPDHDDEPWPVGAEVERDAGSTSSGEPSLALARGPQGGDVGDSRLQAVFLQHRLVAGMPPVSGIDPGVGKLVIQAVVERLLSVPGGIEPLMLLQQDAARLRHGTMVAVVATLFARVLGWPDDRLAELGVAAMLRDIGAVLDDANPRLAGFLWLLQRGAADLWLRSALVASGEGDEPGRNLSATIVGMAVTTVRALEAGAPDLASALAGIAGDEQLLEVLRTAFDSAAV